jgi:hypothetical protein
VEEGKREGEREREREKGDNIGLEESETYRGEAGIEFNSSLLREIFALEIGRSQNSPTISIHI